MNVYRAEPDCYYVLWRGAWYEAVRGEGIHLIELDEGECLGEYMDYVLDGADELDLGDVPWWVIQMTENLHKEYD